MSNYIIIEKNEKLEVINLDNTKKIYCKKGHYKESKEEVITLYADDEILLTFSKEELNSFINKRIFKKNLINKFYKEGNIEIVVCRENVERINKYGYEKVNSYMESFIEVEKIGDDLFDVYSQNIAARFIYVLNRMKNLGNIYNINEVFRNIIISNILNEALDKLEKNNN